MIHVGLAMLSLLMPISAAGAVSETNWRCSNQMAEIRCADGLCEYATQKDGFTPMQLTRAGEQLSLCAYSGCWEGPILTRHTRADVTLAQALVQRVGSADADEEASLLSVIHDAASGTAQMNWQGFANVMGCDADG